MAKNLDTIAKATGLISDMAMELHFRGCDESHPLIRRAGELLPLLKAMEDAPAAPAAARPARLHLLAADEVSVMDLEERLSQGEFNGTDLVEAAFTFENELMACLGDENCMDWDVYAGLTPGELVNVISRSVSDICRYNKG